MHPTERLLNLIALLLDAHRPLTFADIRELLPAYAQNDLTSAKRMFERDKDLLRDLGVPIELASTDAWEVEEGYVIPKDAYYLPEINFTPEEISALFVAANTGGEDSAAEQAVRKLLYGTDGGVLSGVWRGAVAAGPEAGSPRPAAIAEALRERRSVRFHYRTSRGAPSERHVDAWGLVFRGGHWYVVGLDRDLGRVRSFRLSRMRGEVRADEAASSPPEGFRAIDHVQVGPWGPGEPETRARIALAPDVAWLAIKGIEGAKVTRTRKDGWVEVSVPSGLGDELASWVLSFGPDAKALSPPSLRNEVIRRLEEALAGL